MHVPVASHFLHPFAGVASLVQSPPAFEGAVHSSGFTGAAHFVGDVVPPAAAHKPLAHPKHWPVLSHAWHVALGVVVEQSTPNVVGAGHSEGVAGAKHDFGARVVPVAAQ